MKDRCANLLSSTVALVLVLVSSGCATAPYFSQRGRDAADIFTCTVGAGVGAKVRLGPLQAGLLAHTDMFGVRNGTVRQSVAISGEKWFSSEACWGAWGYDLSNFTDVTTARSKSYHARSYVPFIFLPEADDNPPPFSYYTQIEAVLALGPGLRLGMNPGELLDFLLGWVTVDLYGDDLPPAPDSKLEK